MSLLQILAVLFAALVVAYGGFRFVNWLVNELVDEDAIGQRDAMLMRVGGTLTALFFAWAIAWGTGIFPEFETRGGNYDRQFSPNSQGEAVAPELDAPDTGADVDSAREDNKERLERFENSY